MWEQMNVREKAEVVLVGCAAFAFIVSVLGWIFVRTIDRDKQEKEIWACMHERSQCEYARCESIIRDLPMDEEVANACP
jgi:hypothetical protein